MGHSRSMEFLLIVLVGILLQYCSQGISFVEGARDNKVESQLRILNKSYIKTIQTEVGDVFDCTNINNQPSLYHPLLKNHVIKTRPISNSINTRVDDIDSEVFVSSSSFVKPSHTNAILRKLDCPDGTVPIRRISKNDLVRIKSFSKSELLVSSINNIGDQLDDLENPGQSEFLSIAKTRKDSGIEYVGITARINMNNPPVVENQVSAAQLWIENSNKEEFNSLQAGWMVAPSLFGDNRTRLFGKWQIDGSHKSEGCYNILCPGFIQVDQYHPIGDIIGPISQFGVDPQHDIKIAIFRDGGGNWWLDVEDIKLGYWPVELGFSQLTQGSSVIAWGGFATNLGTIATTNVPPMGNGHFPHSHHDYTLQCYMRMMMVIPTKTIYWEDPTRKIIDTFTSKKQCSNIIYYGHQPFGFGHSLAFGGPGGNCDNEEEIMEKSILNV